MELTIDQALQRGVAAHKEGELQEAERLYRTILQSQPLHPGANHNLGVLAVSVNKIDAALPLFKTALEGNPKIEQFWLSYIDALIKEQQLDNAKQVIEQAKKQGVARENLNALEEKLVTMSEAENIDGASPSQELLSNLVEHYNNGRYEDAHKLAVSCTQEFPKFQFGWKALGAVLKHTGRIAEALTVMQRSVLLSLQDSDAQNNLGNILKELGRLEEAKASYMRAIVLKPDYAEVHSNLGNTLQELKRSDQAEASFRQAIELKSDYAEAHSNLGAALQELRRLDEAEASFNQAIALKPHYAEAHYNLGNTLKELGRLDNAVASYDKAIELKPDSTEANYNLGITLGELGRLEEAEASYKKAIALKPDFAEALSNLGVTLQELGRLKEAEASFNQAIALKPEYAAAMFNLSITQSYMNDSEGEIVSLKNVLQIGSDDYGLRASVNLAICNFLEGDFTESKKHLLVAAKIQEETSSESKNERVYWRYLSNILKWHKNKYFDVKEGKNDKTLYIVGESHSLSSHHLCIKNSGANFFCSAKLIKGCKQWHLGNAFRNQYKHQFETIFFALPKRSYVLVAIGEIDCRLDTGIIAHKRKFPEKQMKEIISNTIENFLNYIVNNNSDCQHKVTIQGVPCPNLDVRNYSEKDVRQLSEVIKIFNYELKMQSNEKGFGFLDTHQLTNKGDGMSNGSWHIDEYHLSPEGMQEAWSQYVFKQKYV